MNVSPTLYAEKLRHVSPFWYKLGAQAWIDKEYPRHLFIETTALCNLSCSYCPREKRKETMDFGLVRKVVDEATLYGARSFSLHLFGEPLLYPLWEETVSYIKSRNFRHSVLLTTNGTTLNRQVDKLVSSGIDKAIWTWRPEAKFTPETKEKLRKWGKFMVRLIEEITPPEALAEWGNWQPQERKNLHNYGGNINTGPFLIKNGLQSLKEDLSVGLSKWPKIRMGKSAIEKRWPCYHLWLAPAVAWNGNILMCCNDPHQKEVLGHFPEMSIHEAWKSPKLQTIRQSHLEGNYGGICTNCDSWKTYPDMFFNRQKK